jgi:hypothetical protein
MTGQQILEMIRQLQKQVADLEIQVGLIRESTLKEKDEKRIGNPRSNRSKG